MTQALDDSYDDAEPAAASDDSSARATEPHALRVIENFAPAPPRPGRGSSGATRDPDADTAVLPVDRPHDDRPRPRRTGTGRGPGRRRLGGLDGLRAVAVMAVVVFHLDFSALPGGFLGVDVFFVISGFLITNLIATEILTDGRLNLRRFYARRAKRLLPTVLVLLLAVSVAAHTFWRDQIPTLRGGVLSSLFYGMNWFLIAGHKDYFVATGRPSMLEHLWSLSIEEQYYLLWPAVVLLLAGTAFAVRRDMDPVRRMRAVVWVALALAVASTVLMAWHAVSEDLPYGGSTSRVYFGTDTHTMGLFLGSALGALLALRHARRTANAAPRTPPVWRRASVVVTDVVGLVALVVACAQFVDVDEYVPRLYRGGFLAFDAVVLVAVLCAVRPGSMFGRVLDVRPVRWIGQRSYSIYIWHWPVVVVTRPDQDVHGPTLWINVVRLALVLGLSALSYRFVEVPLRTRTWRPGALRTTGRRPRPTVPDRRNVWTLAAVGVTVVSAVALVSNPVGGDITTSLRSAQSRVAASPRPAPSSAHQSVPSARPGTSSAAHHPVHPSHSAGAGHRPPPAASTLSISAFGDSVLLGARPALAAQLGSPRRLALDAVEGRQPGDILGDVLARAAAHTLRPYVLLHLGDNGAISPDQLKQTLTALAGRKRVVIMTLRVPVDWQDVNNTLIRNTAKAFPNVRVVDWNKESAGRNDWLYSDGIHLRPDGARAYAQIVVKAFRAA